jgi:hypothetical protein
MIERAGVMVGCVALVLVAAAPAAAERVRFTDVTYAFGDAKLDAKATDQALTAQVAPAMKCLDARRRPKVPAGVGVLFARINARGKVTKVEVGGLGDARDEACIASALRKAAFPATTKGGAITGRVAVDSWTPTNALKAVASFDEPSAVGPDRDAVVKVVMTRAKAIQKCYERALEADPMVAAGGKLVVRLTIAADGKLTAHLVTKAFTPSIDDCVVKQVRTLRYPKSDKGGTVMLPIVFKTSE